MIPGSARKCRDEAILPLYHARHRHWWKLSGSVVQKKESSSVSFPYHKQKILSGVFSEGGPDYLIPSNLDLRYGVFIIQCYNSCNGIIHNLYKECNTTYVKWYYYTQKMSGDIYMIPETRHQWGNKGSSVLECKGNLLFGSISICTVKREWEITFPIFVLDQN